ncbi:hypothetical protein MPSEU_000342900 [Mayamaea pseudoterrestris]|nr:hypothetical protein MPSEU_000342900 [Mayamaea pseudoterrestris]
MTIKRLTCSHIRIPCKFLALLLCWQLLASAFGWTGRTGGRGFRLPINIQNAFQLPSKFQANIAHLTLHASLINGELTDDWVGEQQTQRDENVRRGPSHSQQHCRRATLSPFQVIDPLLAAPYNETTPITLYQALNVMRDACRVIASNKGDDLNLHRNWKRLLPFDMKNDDFATANNATTIIRLQLPISHPVDPLAWLHAQSAHRPNAFSKAASFYLHTQQQQSTAALELQDDDPKHPSSLESHRGYEIASLFSAISYKSTTAALQAVQFALPPQSRLYGGARFDANNNTTISSSNEWKNFGQALWMLPGVEMRVDKDNEEYPTLAIHIVVNHDKYNIAMPASLKAVAAQASSWLSFVSDAHSHASPCTTLPPIISRESNYHTRTTTTTHHDDTNSHTAVIDGQELFERGLEQALGEINESSCEITEGDAQSDQSQPVDEQSFNQTLTKVVLARRQTLHFATLRNEHDWTGLQVVRRWKYGGHEGGHLFYMRVEGGEEFFGCTPERLFRVSSTGENNVSSRKAWVHSEALAGTRPRGSSPEADEELLQELMSSPKDQTENRLTGLYIQERFKELEGLGYINEQERSNEKTFFVRRLLHLQHICQRFSAQIRNADDAFDVTRYLLQALHPTPAVCGVPVDKAIEFIRQYETVGFDRGYYSGPVGYIGINAADVLVAIRSGLASRNHDNGALNIHVYAGVGLVSGSTLAGEWAETNSKLAVLSSMFPQSPLTLKGATNANLAWSTAFVEELVRNGITQFYICPGSRSTPLVVAIARAVRANVGVVNAVSVHDERAAGFRAIGYARGCGRPAAVLTSSGTAVANLYPAIVEAGVDGVPMVVLTADRPYESRNTGANQAIDQVKMFSPTYVRWYRDVLPPDDNVPVNVALSDAAHAVSFAKNSLGPVHVNIQFRENLAPDAGPIRNDNRGGAISEYNGKHFTDVAGFVRWSTKGDCWTKTFAAKTISEETINEMTRLILESKRGIIVVGNIREEASGDRQLQVVDLISTFAQSIGFPILAGAQSAALRFRSPAVVPFAEHLLKCPEVAENLKPDLIIQLGSPLVSTGIPALIESTMRRSDQAVHHILIHPATAGERADPGFTITHNIHSGIEPFLKGILVRMNEKEGNGNGPTIGSELSSLVLLGRKLQGVMKSIINDASATIAERISDDFLSEPEIVVALAESMSSQSSEERSLFVSNSMPIRDCEFFFYPFHECTAGPYKVGSNRGASGIDGIISSAHGFAESGKRPTTLLIGDLATLHDLTSLHALSNEHASQGPTGKSRHPLTIVIVNNNGGGIFSFLPIAKHGADASFTEYFGTPTKSFSFQQGTNAFGLSFTTSNTINSFKEVYLQATRSCHHCVIEAVVAAHEVNVAVHQEITKSVMSFVRDFLQVRPMPNLIKQRLPVKSYGSFVKGHKAFIEPRKTLVLLHGFLGDKAEWDETASLLSHQLSASWNILAIDLPGHGLAPLIGCSDRQMIQSALNLLVENEAPFSIESMAATVLNSLSTHHGVKQVHAIAGYSLGGRIALAMKQMCDSPLRDVKIPILLRPNAKLIILGAYPGDLNSKLPVRHTWSGSELQRVQADEALANRIISIGNSAILKSAGCGGNVQSKWSSWLSDWYSAPIWGEINQRERYADMINKRCATLNVRGRDCAAILYNCSPPKTNQHYWKSCSGPNTLFLAGSLDTKYSEVGRALETKTGIMFRNVENAGHALLVENTSQVSEHLVTFLSVESVDDVPSNLHKIMTNESVEVLLLEPGERQDSQDEEPPATLSWDANAQVGKPNHLHASIQFITFEQTSIQLVNGISEVSGIGWGNAARITESTTSNRDGLLVQIAANDVEVGVGEICPLNGLHDESFDEARDQIERIRDALEHDTAPGPTFYAPAVVAMEGALREFLIRFADFVGIKKLHASVYSGLEMALLSLAARIIGSPLHQLLPGTGRHQKGVLLPINGITTRGSERFQAQTFPSMKVKVGHQSLADDLQVMSNAYGWSDSISSLNSQVKVRADANRAWNESEAIEFVSALEGVALQALEQTEFIEEPLKVVTIRKDNSLSWIEAHVETLERWFRHTGMRYALDETIADLMKLEDLNVTRVEAVLAGVFAEGPRGCAAFVLKPTVLGIEASMSIARLARSKLGIAAVFSSSFESGVGLTITSLLASSSDQIHSAAPQYAHGLGTFTLLSADTMSPPFSSYVNAEGMLNVPSLSRAIYGLCLEDLCVSRAGEPPVASHASPLVDTNSGTMKVVDYKASTSSSGRGGQISVVVSLPLPFSAQIAAARFTDLPQQSRWSPWISSVAYQGDETKWSLNVKGIPLTWRAKSQILLDPPGIEWESVSGLSNRGKVEFLPATSKTECTMKVQMTLLTPRLLRPLFKGTSLFLEDFLRDKLLKWSLEMFRDVVKADLALERGDVELGDALYSAVEGKASAIEATLDSEGVRSLGVVESGNDDSIESG